MLSILIFALVLFVIGWISYKKNKKDFDSGIIAIYLTIFIFGSSLIITAPFAGYEEEPVKEEVKLSVLSEKEDTKYYLMISENEEYIYKVIEPINAYGIVDENINIIRGSNIKYFEDEKLQYATLVEYTYEPKRNLFTMALGAQETENVFFLPKGSVLE